MNNIKPYPTFGKLLNYYRNARGLSLAELRRLLSNLEYKLSLPTLKKYESGESFPPPSFVTACIYCMNIGGNQWNSLIDAIHVDFLADQGRQYKNAMDELRGKGKFGIRKYKKHITSVFISYSRKDEDVTEVIAKHLKQAGIDCWLDKKEISIGEPIIDRIREGIARESEYVLMMLSKHSLNSEWCKLELRMAYEKELLQKRIIVVPVKIDNTDPPEEIRIKRYFELDPYSLASVNTLIREIKQLIKKQRASKGKSIENRIPGE